MNFDPQRMRGRGRWLGRRIYKEQSAPISEKLIVAAAADHPTASEILVSFPDQYQLVHSFQRGDILLYVAAFPISHERPRRDNFFGLSPEINQSLTDYRMYKLFEPWPQPLFQVIWDRTQGEGRVVGQTDLKIHLHPLGQAQVWKGETHGVLWECFWHGTRQRQEHWQEELAQFWQVVEEDMGVKKIFTQPHEPTFEEKYTEFLSRLGYAPDPEFEHWWSKER